MVASAFSEAPLDREAFAHVAALAYARAGLVVREEKAVMVSGRLARRARALGLPDLASYARRLRGPEAEAEIPFLINALTTNHTAFFRERHHLEHLAQEVLPRLATAARGGAGWVRLWSAACSTGEEPYSMAAAARRALGPGPLPGLKILATDIDTEVLAAAHAARYPADGLAEVPAEWRSLLAPGQGRGEEMFAIPEELKELVAFRHLNLIGPWPMRPGYAAIFCRNVFIYFDAATKAQIVDRFAELLSPGGYLYLGHTEFLTTPHPVLESVGKTIYRRRP
jgi:chemotaxis protein methyltransferase CheR